MSNSTIIVTGGAGYIGSHTILELIRNTDYEIVSIDNFINSSQSTFDKISDITGRSIKNYQVDLCDAEGVDKVFQNTQNLVGVIHFAALKSVPDSVADPVGYYKNNLESLMNMLSACERFGIKNFVFSSSCSVYGNVETLPVNEQTPLSVTESPYASTKLIGEEIIRHVAQKGDIKTVLLRYFNPVGADISGKLGENPINKPNNLAPVITQTAIGIIPKMQVFGDDYDTRDGSCVRDYVHVSDIAEAHLKALSYLMKGDNTKNYEIFNLGTGNGVTVLEAISAFETVSNQKLNYEVVGRRDGDVAAIYSDSSKAKTALNWEPKYDINDMMKTAWVWQQYIFNKK